MNKEYVYLSDKELLVIDEKGNATKRNVENNDIHHVLLIENKLEIINEKISEEEEKINKEKARMLSKKEKAILAIIPFIFPTSAYGIACLIEPSVISHIILAMTGIFLGTAITDIAFIIDEKDNHKRMNSIKNELSTAYHMKEELEKKLIDIKEKSNDKKADSKLNDVIFIEEPSQFVEEVHKQLTESYEIGYKQKVKRLTLKNRKKN